jgi:hypothetical protein
VESGVIEARRRQRSFGDGLIAEEIEDLQESWMRHVDVVLQDEVIVSTIYQTLAKRYPNSRSDGRPGYRAEVVLRLLILKLPLNCEQKDGHLAYHAPA